MLLNMNPKKFSGPVGIPRAFLRHYAQQISGFITHIFQLSLNASIIPLNWSKAHVLIYKKKKGDHLSIKNYHPVSVTSTCCKLLEHTVANYIYEFLMQENVLSSYQDGFKRNMLVVTQLVSAVHEFSRVLDVPGRIDVLFVYFCKAFDTVSHVRLLFKLECLGLSSGIVHWVKAYLRNRTRYVEVRGCCELHLVFRKVVC